MFPDKTIQPIRRLDKIANYQNIFKKNIFINKTVFIQVKKVNKLFFLLRLYSRTITSRFVLVPSRRMIPTLPGSFPESVTSFIISLSNSTSYMRVCVKWRGYCFFVCLKNKRVANI